MDERLTIELKLADSGEPQISCMVRRGRTLVFARSGWLKPPYSTLGIAGGVHSLVRAWLAPELAPDASQAFTATWEAVTDDPAMA